MTMEILQQYGLPGAIIAGLIWYFLRVEKEHKEERKEWRNNAESERKEWRGTIEKMSDEQNKLTRENTSVLSSLKTMLENRK